MPKFLGIELDEPMPVIDSATIYIYFILYIIFVVDSLNLINLLLTTFKLDAWISNQRIELGAHGNAGKTDAAITAAASNARLLTALNLMSANLTVILSVFLLPLLVLSVIHRDSKNAQRNAIIAAVFKIVAVGCHWGSFSIHEIACQSYLIGMLNPKSLLFAGARTMIVAIIQIYISFIDLLLVHPALGIHAETIEKYLLFQPRWFPSNKTQFTLAWLKSQPELQQALPKGAVIQKFVIEPLSGPPSAENDKKEKQQGFVGETLRLRLFYSIQGQESVLESVSFIIKMTPSNLFGLLKMRLGAQVYYREHFFYNTIATKHIYPSQDPNMLQVPSTKAVYYNSMRGTYLLIMEDCSAIGLKIGSELVGGTWEQACSTAIRYGKFNALYWCPSLQELNNKYPNLRMLKTFDWMETPKVVLDRVLWGSFDDILKDEGLRSVMTLYSKQVIVKFFKYQDEFFETLRRTRPMTLIHADTRVENMLFPTIESNTKIIVAKKGVEFNDAYAGKVWKSVDWQTMTKGLTSYDLAYYVGLDLEVEIDHPKDRLECDMVLLQAYYDTLCKHNPSVAKSYSFDDCFLDYQLSILISAVIPCVVMSPKNLGGDEAARARGYQIRKAMLTRVCKAIDRVEAGTAFDKILDLAFENSKRIEPFKYKSSFNPLADHFHGRECRNSDEGFTHHTKESLSHLPPADPKAKPGTTVKDAYDRWFLNGFNRTTFFGVGLGFYPGRRVVDASFSIVHKGFQHNIRASRAMDDIDFSSSDVTVGPIRVSVIDPLKKVRLTVNYPEKDIYCDVEFTSRFDPSMEPPFKMSLGSTGDFNYERLTQLVLWNGTIKIFGDEMNITKMYGTRDRSWGIRPHMTADNSAAKNKIRNGIFATPIQRKMVNSLAKKIIPLKKMPQFYWLWCPIHLENGGILCHSQEDLWGSPTNHAAKIYRENDDSKLPNSQVTRISHATHYRPGTRHAKSLEVSMKCEKGSEIQVKFKPRFTFFMSGIGYNHPEFGHAVSHKVFKTNPSAVVVHYDVLDTDLVDPMRMEYLHIQEVCDIEVESKNLETGETMIIETGLGCAEQFIVGPHDPSGFESVLDA